MLPFDAFATRIKIFDQIHVKVCLIFPSKVLDCLIFCGSKVELEPRALGPQFSCYLDPLISSQKGLWSLILVANVSTRDDNWRHQYNAGEPILSIHLRENLYIHVHLFFKTAGSVDAASQGQTVNYTCVVDAMFDSICWTHFLSSGGCAFVLIVALANWKYLQSQGGRFRGGFNWNSSVRVCYVS